MPGPTKGLKQDKGLLVNSNRFSFWFVQARRFSKISSVMPWRIDAEWKAVHIKSRARGEALIY